MRNAPAMHGSDHCPGGPDPIPCFPTGSSQWASVFLSPTSGGSAGGWVYCDIDSLVTNAPDIFGINTGANGSQGLEILVDDIELRMWAGFDVEVNQSGLTGSYDGLSWNNFFSYWGRVSNENTKGWRVTAGFHGASDAIRFAAYTLIDLERSGGSGPVAATPANVIEFGFTQNTTFNADINGGAMFQVLTTDLSTVTYLP